MCPAISCAWATRISFQSGYACLSFDTALSALRWSKWRRSTAIIPCSSRFNDATAVGRAHLGLMRSRTLTTWSDFLLTSGASRPRRSALRLGSGGRLLRGAAGLQALGAARLLGLRHRRLALD